MRLRRGFRHRIDPYVVRITCILICFECLTLRDCSTYRRHEFHNCNVPVTLRLSPANWGRSDMESLGETVRPATFGRRKLTPRACVADSKRHIRTFLADALEELGFVTFECAEAADLKQALDTQTPDLVVLGL